MELSSFFSMLLLWYVAIQQNQLEWNFFLELREQRQETEWRGKKEEEEEETNTSPPSPTLPTTPKVENIFLTGMREVKKREKEVEEKSTEKWVETCLGAAGPFWKSSDSFFSLPHFPFSPFFSPPSSLLPLLFSFFLFPFFLFSFFYLFSLNFSLSEMYFHFLIGKALPHCPMNLGWSNYISYPSGKWKVSTWIHIFSISISNLSNYFLKSLLISALWPLYLWFLLLLLASSIIQYEYLIER